MYSIHVQVRVWTLRALYLYIEITGGNVNIKTSLVKEAFITKYSKIGLKSGNKYYMIFLQLVL